MERSWDTAVRNVVSAAPVEPGCSRLTVAERRRTRLRRDVVAGDSGALSVEEEEEEEEARADSMGDVKRLAGLRANDAAAAAADDVAVVTPGVASCAEVGGGVARATEAIQPSRSVSSWRLGVQEERRKGARGRVWCSVACFVGSCDH